VEAREVLLREDDHGVIAIGQASHAWISGQLARAWGNAQFGTLDPYEEVCLAAEQHDVGMARWDLHPTRNPATGLPHSFLEMPLRIHVALWSAGPERLLSQSAYAALLVSMHGARLYRRRDLEKLAPEDAGLVREFLADQERLQQRLRAQLAADGAALARNAQLLWIWDYLSLSLCLHWMPCTAHKLPSPAGPVELEVLPREEPGSFIVDPWPFAARTLTVSCEGRRLTGPYDSDEALQGALDQARPEAVEFELLPLLPA
jgi:hypothetical protein